VNLDKKECDDGTDRRRPQGKQAKGAIFVIHEDPKTTGNGNQGVRSLDFLNTNVNELKTTEQRRKRAILNQRLFVVFVMASILHSHSTDFLYI
jgi:hypothetical protein